MQPQTAVLTAPAPRIETREGAERLVAEIGGILERLSGLIAEETRLLRRAKLVDASALQPDKAELSNAYVAALERLRANATMVGRHAPVAVDQLRRRHEAFQAELQVNMAVLATARSVTEGLVRGVGEEMAARSRPRTYGASGTLSVPPTGATQPISVSRQL